MRGKVRFLPRLPLSTQQHTPRALGRKATLSIPLSSEHHVFQWFTWRAGQLTGNQLFDFQGEPISIVFKQIGPPRELRCPVCLLHAVSRWGENLWSIEGVNSNRGTRQTANTEILIKVRDACIEVFQHNLVPPTIPKAGRRTTLA